jgi:hypothetical protein
MSEPTLVVGHSLADPSRVWVNLRPPGRSIVVQYYLDVPWKAVPIVFPGRAPKVPWRDAIWSDITELGSFVVEGYLQNLASHEGRPAEAYEWTITTVDEVTETDEGIRLTGRAVPFDRSLGVPELKTLE